MFMRDIACCLTNYLALLFELFGTRQGWFGEGKYIGFSLALANHKILASRVDNIHRQGLKAVDRDDAFYLSQSERECMVRRPTARGSLVEKTSLRKCIRPFGGDQLSWP